MVRVVVEQKGTKPRAETRRRDRTVTSAQASGAVRKAYGENRQVLEPEVGREETARGRSGKQWARAGGRGGGEGGVLGDGKTFVRRKL